MPELRKDPILGRWIIISQERRKRPTDFVVERSQESSAASARSVPAMKGSPPLRFWPIAITPRL